MGPVASQLVMIGLIIGVFYFIVMRPQQKKQQAHREMLANLKNGERVVTTGGMIGRISGMNDREITIEVAEKIRVKVLRSHIAGKYGAEIPAPEGSS